MQELIRSSFVIARRDFSAIIFSKAFFFFLLGPLFPLAIFLAAGALGSQMAEEVKQPNVAVLLPTDEAASFVSAHDRLKDRMGERRFPAFETIAPEADTAAQAGTLLSSEGKSDEDKKFVAVLSGSFAEPVLTGPADDVNGWQGEIGLIIDTAKAGASDAPVEISRNYVASSDGAKQKDRLITAQVGQFVLFLLTMLLAGMVLSNLVEEKTNKIIEILAAAVPIESIFFGKLFAMLGMAFIGIAVWFTAGATAIEFFGPGIPSFAVPAVGWPFFIILAFLYFAMAYLLLGSLFLGIGAMATTVREVQTLSMPVTMLQLLVFGFASYALTKLGEPVEQASAIFPFSSPFAMLARAAQMEGIWQHLLAFGWQMLWAAIIVRISAGIFKRNVMKSGGQRRGFFKRLFARPA